MLKGLPLYSEDNIDNQILFASLAHFTASACSSIDVAYFYKMPKDDEKCQTDSLEEGGEAVQTCLGEKSCDAISFKPIQIFWALKLLNDSKVPDPQRAGRKKPDCIAMEKGKESMNEIKSREKAEIEQK